MSVTGAMKKGRLNSSGPHPVTGTTPGRSLFRDALDGAAASLNVLAKDSDPDTSTQSAMHAHPRQDRDGHGTVPAGSFAAAGRSRGRRLARPPKHGVASWRGVDDADAAASQPNYALGRERDRHTEASRMVGFERTREIVPRHLTQSATTWWSAACWSPSRWWGARRRGAYRLRPSTRGPLAAVIARIDEKRACRAHARVGVTRGKVTKPRRERPSSSSGMRHPDGRAASGPGCVVGGC